MDRLEDTNEIALYVWDYFYLANSPAPGDERTWAVIERATCRIRESEPSLGPASPPDVRLRSARRIRNAVRLTMRHIERLSTQPARWVIDGLLKLEAVADDVIRNLSGAAGRVVIH